MLNISPNILEEERTLLKKIEDLADSAQVMTQQAAKQFQVFKECLKQCREVHPSLKREEFRKNPMPLRAVALLRHNYHVLEKQADRRLNKIVEDSLQFDQEWRRSYKTERKEWGNLVAKGLSFPEKAQLQAEKSASDKFTQLMQSRLQWVQDTLRSLQMSESQTRLRGPHLLCIFQLVQNCMRQLNDLSDLNAGHTRLLRGLMNITVDSYEMINSLS